VKLAPYISPYSCSHFVPILYLTTVDMPVSHVMTQYANKNVSVVTDLSMISA
jgi:hypothetical protein